MLRAALLAAGLLWAGIADACEASWYQHGSRTANGEHFNPGGMTCAHPSYRFGTVLRVTWRGRSVLCRVNDRGPFIAGRCLDLSYGSAKALGMLGAGVANVSIERVR